MGVWRVACRFPALVRGGEFSLPAAILWWPPLPSLVPPVPQLCLLVLLPLLLLLLPLPPPSMEAEADGSFPPATATTAA
jgi:hypothetical protein